MISMRNAINPQAQAVGGRTTRYEAPVSSFTTQPQMQPVSRTPQAQAPQTRQPIEAPSTLEAIASGISGGGGVGTQANLGGSYAPANDFERGVDEAVFGSGTGVLKDRLVSGLVNATMAALMEAPTDAVIEAGIQGTVPGIGSLLSMGSDLATGAIAKNQIMDSYGSHMQDFSREGYDTYQESREFEKAGDEMAVGGTVQTPGAFSTSDKSRFGMFESMQDEAADRTRNPLSQTAREIGEQLGLVGPQRTIYDDVVLPEEMLRRMQYGTSAPHDGMVQDRGLEESFMSNLTDDAVNEYSDYGIDVRSELPYSPLDPMTMQPLGKAVPTDEYAKAFDAKFGSVFGGGGGGGFSGGGSNSTGSSAPGGEGRGHGSSAHGGHSAYG